MGNRFHNKIHRKNHHTYNTPGYPDSGRDPIASPNEPFMGDFVLNGSISASPSLSAYAGYFSTDADNATTLIIKSVGDNSTGLYVSGGIGIVTKSLLNDYGSLNLDEYNITYPNFTNGYIALSSNGNVLIENALSAQSIWTTSLYATSAILLVTDLHISELSGFIVNGSDYNATIPDYIDPNIQQVVLLNGIGLSGTSWASFGGDIKTENSLYVTGSASIVGDVNVNNDVNIANILTVSGDAIINGDVIVGSISGTTIYLNDSYLSNLVVSNNVNINNDLYVSGDSTFLSTISSQSTIYANDGNSDLWNDTTTTVATLSSTWESRVSTFKQLSSDDIILYGGWSWTTPPSNINAIFDGNDDTHWGEATYTNGGGSGISNIAYWNLSGDYIGWVFCKADVKSSNSIVSLGTLNSTNSAFIGSAYPDNIGGVGSPTYFTIAKLIPFYGNTAGLYFTISSSTTGYYKIRRLEFYLKDANPGDEPL